MAIAVRRLQHVLNVKHHQEKKAHVELVRVQERKEEEADVLSELQIRESFALEETDRSFKAQAREIQANRAFLNSLSQQIKAQQQRIEEIVVEEDLKREHLVERSQAKKVIEKLKEKMQIEETKENERKEQRLIDVLAQRIKFGF